MRRKFSAAAFAATLAGSVFADNAVFNGSFELGTDGFALVRFLRPDTNPKLEFRALETAPGASGISGKTSLKIENPYTESFTLYSREFKLKPDTVYRLSIRMSASADNVRAYISAITSGKKLNIVTRTFTLSKEWKEYSFKFTSEKKDGNCCHFTLSPGKKMTSADIFIDDLRVTEENAPSLENKVDAIAVSDRDIYRRGENARLTLKLFNPSEKTFDGPVTISVTDEYTKKTFFRKELTVKLAPGETQKLQLDPLSLTRFGGYRITVSGKELRTHDGFFAVFGPYVAKPFDVLSDFVVAVNDGPHLRIPPEVSHISYEVWNMPLERRFEIYAMTGCRLMRDHDGGMRGTTWSLLEPEKGKFDFSCLDFQMNLLKKYNITSFPVIGNGHWIRNRRNSFPAWAKLKKVQPDPPNCMRQARGHVYMPDDKEFYTYIYETVKHLKGLIPIYELMNEPNFYLSPEDYVRELKIAHEAIRKADPDAKIAGFCLSTDFGANGRPWMNRCLKLGGLEYADIFSFHPYASPQLGSLKSADEEILKLRNVLKQNGKPGMPLLNSELYYLDKLESLQKEDPALWNDRVCAPNQIITRTLIDLGENIIQSAMVHPKHIYKSMLIPHRPGRFVEFIPSEKFVALNTLARLFERAKPVGKYRYDNGVICYVFRDQHRKLIAAVWSYQGRAGLSADLSAFQVMDLFGNEEKPEVKPLKKDEPYFLTQGKLSEQEFMDKIKDLKPVFDNPVSAGELGRLAGDTLFVMLHNSADKPFAVTLGLNGKGLIARKSVKAEIPAKGNIPVEIPVKIKDENVKDAILVIRINGNFFRREIRIIRNPMIKGSFEGKNFKGTLKFGKGEINMNLTVQDASDAGETGKRKPWETDCVELFFDTDPLHIPERFAQNFTADTFRIFITPRDGKLTAQGIDPAKCRHSVKCGKDSYTVELSIPAKTGKYLGFECKIDDYDAAGKKVGETQIGKGAALFKNRCSFVLAKEK